MAPIPAHLFGFFLQTTHPDLVSAYESNLPKVVRQRETACALKPGEPRRFRSRWRDRPELPVLHKDDLIRRSPLEVADIGHQQIRIYRKIRQRYGFSARFH